MVYLKASARAAAPASPVELYDRSIFVNEELTLKAKTARKKGESGIRYNNRNAGYENEETRKRAKKKEKQTRERERD